MPQLLLRGGLRTSASGFIRRWMGILRLKSTRYRVARVLGIISLFALLISTVSSVDELLQHKSSRYGIRGHRFVHASKLTRASRSAVLCGNTIAVLLLTYSDPVSYSADDPTREVLLHGNPSSRSYGSAHTKRAPPPVRVMNHP